MSEPPVVTRAAVEAAAQAAIVNADRFGVSTHDLDGLARAMLDAALPLLAWAAGSAAGDRIAALQAEVDRLTAIPDAQTRRAAERDRLRARVADLEQLAAEILATFTRTEGGHRARAGQVQIQKWHARLNHAEPWNPGGQHD